MGGLTSPVPTDEDVRQTGPAFENAVTEQKERER